MSARQWKAKRRAQRQARIPLCNLCGATQKTLLQGQLSSGESVMRCIEHSAQIKIVEARLEFVRCANDREQLAVKATATSDITQIEEWRTTRPERGIALAADYGFFVVHLLKGAP